MDICLPAHVAHADWSISARKRWVCRAERLPDGHYRFEAPVLAGEAASLIHRLRGSDPKGSLLLGFDFPIGLPLAYARQIGVTDFLTLLPHLGQGEWASFFDVCTSPEEIHLHRPFYPLRPGQARQQHLLDGLGVSRMDELRRACDRKTATRRSASPLFWTLGGQQVGKAAIHGWQEVLQPALASEPGMRLWPFQGALGSLLGPGRVVIAETYPAECYTHLGVSFAQRLPGAHSGKRSQAHRRANAQILLDWARHAQVELAPDLENQILDGFGSRPDGEDRFDAFIGLAGMVNILLGFHAPADPAPNSPIQRVEGWIFGSEEN